MNTDALYVSDAEKHEVRRYDKDGDKKGTLAAGGHGQGDQLNQLHRPTHLFVDAQATLYISDANNNRVMAWGNGVNPGIVVAGRASRDIEQELFVLFSPAKYK